MAAWWQSIETVVGVDFSGAAQAGDFIFLAELDVRTNPPTVRSLDNLGRMVGTPVRDAVLSGLVDRILASRRTLWGIDFPFALPVELFDDHITFARQLTHVTEAADDAKAFGRACVARCEGRLGRKHVRRLTDIESRTPFDCYHYRIIHQTFHGMRRVLHPLKASWTTSGVGAVLPFDRPDGATVFVAESCPGSTLKRWGLPHQNYKHALPGPLPAVCRRTRAVLYRALREKVSAPPAVWNRIARNRGGDALDSLVAALGVWEAARRYDPLAVATHPRYPREGLVFF
ncbi:MAG: DUF429 domain-containing protein [Tepidisphaerales bacterium]